MSEVIICEPIFGGWYIEEFLGKGGFGEVYSISRKQLGLTQYAAVKQIYISNDYLKSDPKLLNRVKLEVAIMMKMRGVPNIVSIEDFEVRQRGNDCGKDILIRMELLECLQSILDREILDINSILIIGIHICRALEMCDKNAIIHRDIRPPNIFRSPHGEYKLGDFGIARITNKGKSPTYASTDVYMAPELLSYNTEYDKRVDIYSLGLTLYALLNRNQLPFKNETIVRIVPTLKNVPEWLSKVINKACAVDPNDRYSSAREMREDIEKGGCMLV